MPCIVVGYIIHIGGVCDSASCGEEGPPPNFNSRAFHSSCGEGRVGQAANKERFSRSEFAFGCPFCKTARMDWRTGACDGKRKLSSCLPM